MPIRITQNKIIFNDNTEMTTAPSVQASFPSGTVALFQQTSAPTGWTKITTYNDYALRLVSGTVGAYTGGLSFTTAFSSSRIPTGSVFVSIDNHPSSSTSYSSSGVSVNPTTVTGTYSGSTRTSPVSLNGTTGVSEQASNETEYSSVTINGNTEYANTGILQHEHSYTYVSSVTPQTMSILDSGSGSAITVVTGISVSTSSGITGSAGSVNGSNHRHSVDFSGGSHNHTITLPPHSHTISLSNVGSHSHTYEGSFTSTQHTHTVNDPQHIHSTPVLTHSVTSSSFSGNSMAFNVNYVDVILASKN